MSRYRGRLCSVTWKASSSCGSSWIAERDRSPDSCGIHSGLDWSSATLRPTRPISFPPLQAYRAWSIVFRRADEPAVQGWWNPSEACSALVTEGGIQFPANGSNVSPVKQAWVYITTTRGKQGLSSRSAAAGGCPHEQPNAARHDGEIQVQCERPWPKQVVERHNSHLHSGLSWARCRCASRRTRSSFWGNRLGERPRARPATGLHQIPSCSVWARWGLNCSRTPGSADGGRAAARGRPLQGREGLRATARLLREKRGGVCLQGGPCVSPPPLGRCRFGWRP